MRAPFYLTAPAHAYAYAPPVNGRRLLFFQSPIFWGSVRQKPRRDRAFLSRYNLTL